MNPNFAEAYNNRGTIYFQMTEFEKALEDYEKAIELQSDFFHAQFNRVATLKLLGREAEAETAEKAMKRED